jgi:hypothetical protein
MKSLSLLIAFAFSGLVLAQDPVAPETPPAEPAKPAEPAENPAVTPTENPADLPPLPDPSPGGEAGELMKNQPGSRLKPAPQREPGLVPEGIVRPGERPKSRSTLKPPTTSADLAARIRYREAHSRAVNDPKIQALWTESRQVPTDGQKRDALRRYYGALYSRILALDKTVAPLVEERRRVSLKRLDQTRVDPTDPLEGRIERD